MQSLHRVLVVRRFGGAGRRGAAADAPGVTWTQGSNIGMTESVGGGFKDETTNRLAWDHNTGAHLLDCLESELVK